MPRAGGGDVGVVITPQLYVTVCICQAPPEFSV